MTKSATLDQEMCILRKLIDNLDASASKVLSDREIDAHRRTGAFQYIPLYTSAFLSQMVQALTMFTKANPGKWPTFIDVGCGIGTKVLLAQACGTNAWGIELNRKYVEVARSRHIAPKQIIHGNALKHDYSAYDIIYFYCPVATTRDRRDVYSMESHRKLKLRKAPMFEEDLKKRIIETAKPGAIIMANPLGQPNHDDVTIVPVVGSGRPLWVKKEEK